MPVVTVTRLGVKSNQWSKIKFDVEQLATEYFLLLTKNIRHEETTKKSSEKFGFGKPFFLIIQNGRHMSKIRNFPSKI